MEKTIVKRIKKFLDGRVEVEETSTLKEAIAAGWNLVGSAIKEIPSEDPEIQKIEEVTYTLENKTKVLFG